MNKIKKLGTFICSLLIIFGTFSNFNMICAAGLSGPYPTKEEPKIDTNLGDGASTTATSAGIDDFSSKIGGLVKIPNVDDYETNLGYALALIQTAINRLLSILATVALIYTLYCGFLIFSSGSGDSGAKKGKAGLKTAIIALAGIALSWLIISLMLRLINTVTVTS